MTEYEKRIASELKNIYKYANANYGGSPRADSPLYKKYQNIKYVIDELTKTNYLEASVLKKRYLEAKSFETIAIELSYSVKHIHRIKKKAIQLFTEKVIQINEKG